MYMKEIQLPKEITDSIEEGGYQTPLSQIIYMLSLLTPLHPKRIIELGTYKGFTTASLACVFREAIVVTVDKYAFYPGSKEALWKKLGVESRIKAVTEDALSFLQKEENESSDFIYVDADKKSLGVYTKEALRVLKVGGIIIVDNIFLQGRFGEEVREQGLEAVAELVSFLDKQKIHFEIIKRFDGLLIVYKTSS